jgi:hypothetical protein
MQLLPVSDRYWLPAASKVTKVGALRPRAVAKPWSPLKSGKPVPAEWVITAGEVIWDRRTEGKSKRTVAARRATTS